MMTEQAMTRRGFLSKAATATSAVTLLGGSLRECVSVGAAEVDRSVTVKTPPSVRQIDVLFDPAHYTAFSGAALWGATPSSG